MAVQKGRRLAQSLRRYFSIILLFFSGLLLSYLTFLAISQYENQNDYHQFKSSFKDKVTSLTQAVSAIDKVFQATHSLLDISPKLSQQDFSSLINHDFLANTGMQGVEWAPAVPVESAASFEMAVRQSGIFDYQIRPMTDGTTVCKKMENNLLFPVQFAQPATILGHELGMQLDTDCNIARNMASSLASRQITSSRFYNDNGELGLRLLQPIFSSEDELRGYIVGIVMINQLVDTLWGELTLSEQYQLSIFDSSDKKVKIYGSQWREDCKDVCEEQFPELTLNATIPFANQVWHIQFSQYKSNSRSSYYAFGGAIAILMITAGLGIYFWSNINKVRWANNLIAQRTQSLRHQANHDELTQLLNRQALTQELEKLTSCYDQQNNPGFCLLFIDLDHFKKINDTMGHLIGDKLLQQVAQRLGSVARSNDLIFRFGGDEFVIILNNSHTQKTVLQVAERILEQLQRAFLIDDGHYRIGASIGAAIVKEGPIPCSEILRNADIAMYEAKKLGRGQVVFFSADMYQDIVYKQTIENALEQAINNHELELHLQPIHSRDALKGFEALTRWHHPEQGTIFPDDFISIAEETGLIHALGAWVIDSACRQLSQWLKQYGQAVCPYISINVSSIQLSQAQITQDIATALTRHQVPPHLLVVELTESALINNKHQVKENLLTLRKLGVRIYLDDFGTGFSSLSLLQDFPIDVLKIDRSFIFGVNENNQESQNLVKAIISMAGALHMDVIAEGVENLTTLNWLCSANCHLLQGYYFSRPLSHQQVTPYLDRQLALSYQPPRQFSITAAI